VLEDDKACFITAFEIKIDSPRADKSNIRDGNKDFYTAATAVSALPFTFTI